MKLMKPFDPLYCICESNFSLKTSKHYEGVFTQGSGYLHIRGSFEEGLEGANQNEEYMRLPANVTIEKPRHPISKWGTYVPGITGIHPLLKEEIVNLPYVLFFKLFANGNPLDMSSSRISNYQRMLDMRDGLLYREFDWEVDDNTTVKCEFTRFVSLARKNLVVQMMNFKVLKGKCELNLISGIDEKVKTNGYNHFASVAKKLTDRDCNVELVTDNNDIVLMASRTFSDTVEFKDNGSNDQVASVVLNENESISVNKLSAVMTSKDETGRLSKDTSLNPLNENTCLNFDILRQQLDDAEKKFEQLYSEHELCWNARWERSGVEIEGDDRAQLAVNFSIYHMLRAANPDNSKVAVCAKGFAGEAYFGHFFWDTEIYLMPFFIYTNPDTAKALAEFRINTLDGAKRNAEKYGYNGAKYPWESSVTGDEQCPNWQYADHEVHINADVVFGLWHYYSATEEEDFLVKAAPVFVETARYWISRVEFRSDGSINLNGVMGPDEYTCFSNNNAYTNMMVSWALKKTVEVVKHIKETNENAYSLLKITDEEIQLFNEVAQKLPVLTLDNKVILQCEGFDRFEELDFEKVWTDRKRPLGQFVSQEKCYRSKALKQADVLMLPFLFPNYLNQEELAANYDYYFKYTTHDSSLSSIVHSILCCRMGRIQDAYDLFVKSLDIDLSEDKAGAAEGIHIANCGGIWQAIVFGFAGMLPCYESGQVSFNPRLPESWKSLKFNIVYRGENYRVHVLPGKSTVERRS
ncbi:MAG TPA: glycoside hydrolase family 65 protein [Clostridiaceae bacterium]|nr:glycoside hydrolase family 65 protein [Clostridiaceae bacterium]